MAALPQSCEHIERVSVPENIYHDEQLSLALAFFVVVVVAVAFIVLRFMSDSITSENAAARGDNFRAAAPRDLLIPQNRVLTRPQSV